MSQFIEQVESRLLFTATPIVIVGDVSALKAAGLQAKAALTTGVSLATTDTRRLKADVAAAHPTAAQRKAFASLQSAELLAVARFKAKANTILNAGDRVGVQLVAALKALEAHPDSAVAQAKVQLQLAKLKAVFSDTAIANIESNAATTVTALDVRLDALATAIPSTQTDVDTFKTDIATDQTTLATQAVAIQGAIATLATDLA